MSQTMSPGELIRDELQQRGWGQEDLARIMGRPVGRINEIIQGKQAISAEIAIELASAFGNDPEAWMQAEAAYRLSLVKEDRAIVRRRARLFGLAPIKEIQKRGWISDTVDIDQLEAELCRFLEIEQVDQEPSVNADFRRTSGGELTPLQKAWYFRTRQLAKAIHVSRFDPARLAKCERELVRLVGFPQEARKVAKVLSSYGIRFVVVEPLPGSKVDGAAFWIGKQSPVIALSLRFDRMDGFWFNLAHEWSHIKHGDALSIDSSLVGQDRVPSAEKSTVERRADTEATALLIPKQQLDSFVHRVAPMYSKERIIQFANKVKIHPGIIVGQLQHRGEIGFHANREMLVKIRDIVVPSSVTDGWGETVNLKVAT